MFCLFNLKAIWLNNLKQIIEVNACVKREIVSVFKLSVKQAIKNKKNECATIERQEWGCIYQELSKQRYMKKNAHYIIDTHGDLCYLATPQN